MKRILCILLAAVALSAVVAMPLRAQAASTAYAGAVTTSGSALNVRSSPSTSSAVVASLRKGSYVTLHTKTGQWWQVTYAKGKTGYCHADYITPVQGTAVTVNTVSGSLNVRSGPGTSYTRIASLAKGETVVLLSTASGWSRILYHGTKTGYVSAQYLSDRSTGNGAVALSVPSFKQTDSRWANVTLGTSGKTIAQIGCATTAIAMMESYRTGTTIYPNAMAQRLTYTPGGSVYWPGNFVTVTSNSLSAVYAQLKQGKPVLYGAKNAYGTQHWVVITGFTGGELIPANFTINDPGTYKRTNLQQFLNAYPTFYKYFYYR